MNQSPIVLCPGLAFALVACNHENDHTMTPANGTNATPDPAAMSTDPTLSESSPSGASSPSTMSPGTNGTTTGTGTTGAAPGTTGAAPGMPGATGAGNATAPGSH